MRAPFARIRRMSDYDLIWWGAIAILIASPLVGLVIGLAFNWGLLGLAIDLAFNLGRL